MVGGGNNQQKGGGAWLIPQVRYVGNKQNTFCWCSIHISEINDGKINCFIWIHCSIPLTKIKTLDRLTHVVAEDNALKCSHWFCFLQTSCTCSVGLNHSSPSFVLPRPSVNVKIINQVFNMTSMYNAHVGPWYTCIQPHSTLECLTSQVMGWPLSYSCTS